MIRFLYAIIAGGAVIRAAAAAHFLDENGSPGRASSGAIIPSAIVAMVVLRLQQYQQPERGRLPPCAQSQS